MSDLLSVLKSKVGLTDDQASKTIECIKEYFDDKMPKFVADKLDGVLDGQKLDLSEMVKNEANNIFSNISDKTGEVTDKVESFIDNLMESFKNKKS